MTGWRGPGNGEQISQGQSAGGIRRVLRRLWRAGSDGPPAAAYPERPDRRQDGTDDRQNPGPGEAHSRVGAAARRSPDSQVPRLLQQAAAWSWRLLLTGLVVYVAFRLAVFLRLVVLPFIAAMLITALLQPAAAWLRRRMGMSPLLATWCMFLLVLIVVAGAIALVANRASADYPALYNEVQHTAGQLQHSLEGRPFHLRTTRLSTYTRDLLNYISKHKSVLAGTALTTGKYALEVLAGTVLTLFIAFFMLKDGDRIWAFVISGTHGDARRRADYAGHAGWRALVYYVRGTIVVATIHGLVMGAVLWLLGVPLVVPFIVLIFLASFVPIIGILAVGALAILVALATKGVIAAIILFGAFVLEDQIEAHLLQPLVVGRFVRLPPLAIILVLALGGIIAGIPGAIIAVPVTAVITYAWPALRDGAPDDD
jgi:predicted PurR-regulated permease PerM